MKKNQHIMRVLTATMILLCMLSFIKSGYGQIVLPYYTGFDSQQEINGWQQYREGYSSAYQWNAGGESIAPVGFSAPACLHHDYNVGGNESQTVIDWFVSPAMQISSEAQLQLKIRTSGFSEPLEDNLEVWFGMVSQNPSLGSYVLLGNLSNLESNNEWHDVILDIPITASQGYIAFRYKTVGAHWRTYSIDNINVTLSPLSIDRNQDKKILEIGVFPNPMSNELTLQSACSMRNTTLLNTQGKIVFTSLKIGEKLTIDTSVLSQGVYILRVITECGVHIERLVKAYNGS